MNIRPVILCGGSGTRLWPASRKSMPKQFLPLIKNETLLDLTFKRVKSLNNLSKCIVVTSKQYSFLVKEALDKAEIEADILLEPIGRNTTASIYLAAAFANKDDTLLIMPSDHLIKNNKKFLEVVLKASKLDIYENWITFGILPTYPSDAYGYIKVQDSNNKSNSEEVYDVDIFIEKPSIQEASQMLKQGNIFWNAGIFMGKASMIMKSISNEAYNIASFCDEAIKTHYIIHNNEINFNLEIFEKIPSKSIDFAVMEHSKNIKLIEFNAQWSDVGSWDSLVQEQDEIEAKKNIIEISGKNNFVFAENRIIATIGVENLIIVDSDNATLISKKGKTEQVKEVVENLSQLKLKTGTEHTFEKRPWGKFENLLDTSKVKVKKLSIKPFKRLSLQYHMKRQEHWFVVSGLASIHLDGKSIELNQGESIDIPKLSKHFIANNTSNELIIIEIQTGEYFGEDDIIRIDDPYSR